MAGQYADGLDENGQWEVSLGNLALEQSGYIVDLGQVPAWMKRQLDTAAKAGRLVKYRGYWDTGLAFAGMGPMKKVIWAYPDIAESAGAFGGTVSGHPFPATIIIGQRPEPQQVAA